MSRQHTVSATFQNKSSCSTALVVTTRPYTDFCISVVSLLAKAYINL